MKRYQPRSWTRDTTPSAPCDHMQESTVGAYVETQVAERRIRELAAVLQGILDEGIGDIDPRLRYVVIQASRETLAQARKALEGK